MKLGIVVVHFGDRQTTKRCLDSLASSIRHFQNQTPSAQSSVLVVDNSGNLEPADIPSEIVSEVLRPDRNTGYAGACYVGARRFADADVLIFSNNDVIVTEGTVSNLLGALMSLERAGAIQPLVLTVESLDGQKEFVESIGLVCDPLMHPFNYSNWPVEAPRETEHSHNHKTMEVFGADGMFLATRNCAWTNVGGWDPDFFMFNEDTLYSWKLRLNGYKNYVALNAVIYHVRGGSAKGEFTKLNPIFPSYYISRNRILSMMYLFKASWILKYVPLSFVTEFAKSFLLSIYRLDSSYILFYAKAIGYVFTNTRKIRYERSKTRKVLDEGPLLNHRLVLPVTRSLPMLVRRFLLDHKRIMK